MPFNINQFYSSINKNGISRSDLFEIFFPGPSQGDDLRFRARSVNLPGRSVNILEYFELGPEYKLGSFPNYTDVSIEFLCSEDLSEREYFLIWQDKIVGNHRRTNFGGFLQSEYYKDYVQNIDINIYNEVGTKTKTVKLLEAFPTTIGDISYDWGNSEYATVDVTFAYRYYETDRYYDANLRQQEKQRQIQVTLEAADRDWETLLIV